MEIFDIGTGELLFIVALAIIFIGPKRMAEVSSTIGKWLNKFVQSDTWKALRNISNEITHAPNRMMREANFEEWQREMDLDPDFTTKNVPTSRPPRRPAPEAGEAVDNNSILPPGRSQAYTTQPPASPAIGETPTPNESGSNPDA